MTHDIVIRADRLGKKYVIGHEAQLENYVALRDVIARGAHSAVRKAADMVKGRIVVPGDEMEEFWALKDVSFEVKRGEVLGIIGRNGAGKSTLLKILSRITEPTEGRVTIKGRVASLLEVGTGFHPELSGRENIYLNGAILGMKRAEIKRKFDEIVAFAEVEKFLDTPVKRYSSGMYVRLAFAVAAHLEPEILIVDEVLAVGDAAFQKKCLGKMQDVSQGGRTVLFVSHNLAAVNTLTTRCAYLVDGTTSIIGSTHEVIETYMRADQDNALAYLENDLTDGHGPRIRAVELRTSSPGNIHFNSEPIEIRLTVHIPRPIDGAWIAVQIFNSDQTNHLVLWTHDKTLPMCRHPGTYLLKCRVPHLRLYMGNYRLRVFFNEPPGGRTFQVLEGICPFEVKMQDFRLFQWMPKESAYLEDFHWEVQQIDRE